MKRFSSGSSVLMAAALTLAGAQVRSQTPTPIPGAPQIGGAFHHPPGAPPPPPPQQAPPSPSAPPPPANESAGQQPMESGTALVPSIIHRHRFPHHNVVAARPWTPAKFGDPLNNLTPAQLAAFEDGLDEFTNREDVASGLGPIFNNVSCVACHSSAAPGGAGIITVTRFGLNQNGAFDPLTGLGGSLLQSMAITPALQEIIPPQANVVAKRQTTPLFGLGLIEAIPDSAILANANRVKLDGVKGRAGLVQDIVTGEMRPGRFGWKAQHPSILGFAADAYLNEMGITNRYFTQENAPNGNTALLYQYVSPSAPIEDQADPQTGKADIDKVADFMRLLAPPPAKVMTPAAMAGSASFHRIGCAECHQPLMFTGTSSIEALNVKPVWLYSDLLLHDMGSLGDGIAQAAAGTQEMKTPPLWGLRASGPYLHDGRAATVDAAILDHDGEALSSRNRYLQLPPQQRQQILEFLNSI